jgi:hypothetical protein
VTHDPANHQADRPIPSIGTGMVVSLTLRRTGSAPLLPGSAASGLGDGSFTIDCADCAHRDTPVCEDCVVSFIVGREPEDALVVDADEARAVRLLERAGLLPGVRHEAQASGL